MEKKRILLKLTLTTILSMLIASVVAGQVKSKPAESYGSATVSSVLRLDEHVRLYCNIDELPPIIGQNIPVRINGLKPAKNTVDNVKLLRFLNDLFLNEKASPEHIVLKNIRRGKEFCLIADIQVDGKDLCDLLIEKKLAQKVIEVSASETTDSTSSAATSQGDCIASKSSKVYHRPTCSHVKRMDTSKAITFPSREDAEKTGRRPCKICKP